MGIDKEFASMMPDTVTVAVQSAVDKYGKQTWSGSTSYQCRISRTQRLIRDQDGREIVQAGQVRIYGVANVTTKDRITLPDGTQPPVVSVDRLSDEQGDHHTVIGFGQ